MAEIQLTLSPPEREYLVQALETILKNHRVEEHRTRSPTYRENVLAEERILEQVLAKLDSAPK